MPNRTVVLSLALAISMALVIRIAGQGTSELQLVTRAADALGGRDRVMAVKTLQIIGYGELAYFNGGGTSPATRPPLRNGRRYWSTHAPSISNTRARVCSSA